MYLVVKGNIYQEASAMVVNKSTATSVKIRLLV